MKVREVMSSRVTRIAADASLTEAARKMRDADVGVLPVEENNQIVGMLTDRDMVTRGLAESGDPDRTVRDIMTPGVLTCREQDGIESAANLMEEQQVHRLLVLNEDDTIAGILSLGDLALKTSDEHLAFEALKRISAPVHSA